MTSEQRHDIMALAIAEYGKVCQMDVAIEEMAELTKALCKIKRADIGMERCAAVENAVEEIADVQIMLDQLRLILGCDTTAIEEEKLERLQNRIDRNWAEPLREIHAPRKGAKR